MPGLLLRHPRLAQPDEISRFEQGADLRYVKESDGSQPGDARITIVTTQLAGTGEFCGGAPTLAVESVG